MDNLAGKLEAIGQELSQLPVEGPLDVSVLKGLKQVELEHYLLPECEAKHRFLAFFLINFFDDVFYNLIGDFPYDEKVHEIRLDFFREAGNRLSVIGKTLSGNDFSAICECSAGLVTLYLDKISEINESVAT